MKGNTFPMDLLCVHHLEWSSDGREAHMWNRRGVTRRATLGGWLLNMASWCGQTHMEIRNDRWIQTDGWAFSVLHIRPHTYWLYRVSENEMVRLVYDDRGTVVWQYRMLRIARDTRTRTQHFDDYMATCRGKPYWLML